jgi:toxin ParE1/3/4
MQVVLHPKVLSDINSIMRHYEEMASPGLAHEFYAEFRHLLVQAAERPESYSARENDIRRVNLQRFPYHFPFRIRADVVRILVVRHHSRHPSFGRNRR